MQRMVVAQGVRLTAAGVILGLIAAVLLTRVLDSHLFGVESLDIPTFLAMSALMVGVALLASYAPAKRATEADPVQILRAG